MKGLVKGIAKKIEVIGSRVEATSASLFYKTIVIVSDSCRNEEKWFMVRVDFGGGLKRMILVLSY